MSKRLYIIRSSDGPAVTAQRYLQDEFNAEVLAVLPHQSWLEYEQVSGRELYYLFSTVTGNFPSKHIRIVSSCEDAATRKIQIPEFVQSSSVAYPGTLVAIRFNIPIAARPRFAEAIRQLHLRDRSGRWLGQKKKKESRLPLHQARKAERAKAGREAILDS